MNANECKCGRPTKDAAYVCDTCGDDLAKALGDVTWLDEELETTITGQKGVDYRTVGGSGGGKKDAERPSPVNWGPAEARGSLRDILVSWTRLCAEEGVRNSSPYPGLPDDNLQAISAWLMWRVDGLTLHEAGSDAVEEITKAVAHCYRIIDRPAEQEFVGPCECGRDLYRRGKAPLVKCRQCEKEWDVAELGAWMASQMEGKLVTVREGSLLLGKFGIPTAIRTLQRWGDTGKILPHGTTPKGGSLYLFDDLIQQAARKSA